MTESSQLHRHDENMRDDSNNSFFGHERPDGNFDACSDAADDLWPPETQDRGRAAVTSCSMPVLYTFFWRPLQRAAWRREWCSCNCCILEWKCFLLWPSSSLQWESHVVIWVWRFVFGRVSWPPALSFIPIFNLRCCVLSWDVQFHVWFSSFSLVRFEPGCVKRYRFHTSAPHNHLCTLTNDLFFKKSQMKRVSHDFTNLGTKKRAVGRVGQRYDCLFIMMVTLDLFCLQMFSNRSMSGVERA